MDPSGKQWAKKQIRGFSTAMFIVGTLGSEQFREKKDVMHWICL